MISKDGLSFILSFPMHQGDNGKNVSYLKIGLINRRLQKSDVFFKSTLEFIVNCVTLSR